MFVLNSLSKLIWTSDNPLCGGKKLFPDGAITSMKRTRQYWGIRIGILILCGLLVEVTVWVSLGQVIFLGVGVVAMILLIFIWGVAQFENI